LYGLTLLIWRSVGRKPTVKLRLLRIQQRPVKQGAEDSLEKGSGKLRDKERRIPFVWPCQQFLVSQQKWREGTEYVHWLRETHLSLCNNMEQSWQCYVAGKLKAIFPNMMFLLFSNF